MEVENNADYVMTYGELQTLMNSCNVTFEPAEPFKQEASIFGKAFASSGGVANAVLECMKERGQDTDSIKVRKCTGGKDCVVGVKLLQMGRLPEDFIEAMICEGGCVGGPSKHSAENEIKKARTSLLAKADKRGILENLEQYPMDSFSMIRENIAIRKK
jgi:ferredoxin hydrogenase large subunit